MLCEVGIISYFFQIYPFVPPAFVEETVGKAFVSFVAKTFFVEKTVIFFIELLW